MAERFTARQAGDLYPSNHPQPASSTWAICRQNGHPLAAISLPDAGASVIAATICQMLEQAYALGREDKRRDVARAIGL